MLLNGGEETPFLAVVCNLIVWMQKWFCLSQLLFPSQEQLAIVIKMLKQNQNTRNLPKTFLSKDALHQTIETLLKNILFFWSLDNFVCYCGFQFQFYSLVGFSCNRIADGQTPP